MSPVDRFIARSRQMLAEWDAATRPACSACDGTGYEQFDREIARYIDEIRAALQEYDARTSEGPP